MIQPQRIHNRNNRPIQDREYVLYWMQAAQRAEYNHALEYAIKHSNQRKKPVLVAFSVTDDFPEANERHYAFMLQGLKETQTTLAKRNIQLVILQGKPEQTIPELAKKGDILVMDEGYLRIQQQWRDVIAEMADCRVCEVTTNLIVPVEEASDKENFSAGTLRPRIHKQLNTYLLPLKHTKPKQSSLNLKFKSFDIADTEKALKKLKIDRSVKASPFFTGGTSEAKKRLKRFIKDKLDDYADKRNDPMLDCQSNLSPYLHFGQISPLYIALEIMKTDSPGKDGFLEELIVRRELSNNFVYYNSQYDDYNTLPPWALRTLNYHAKDKREYIYSLEQFETGQTHDPYWNAAQIEMVITGKMHNYMRMYWGKKILEWTKKPKDAFKIALYLNNKYELDGRDPNGFSGVAWCFGKHDRAWNERPIFGKVRYMNAAGLKRKFDIDAYVEKIKAIERETK
ncbi:MAG: deoxyribodipyrimidine photo-lyase [Planctomycetes bacterium]|nr:deoxyribodipyrimidine photo-lyase [Planctomycetota bacterium]